MSDIVLRTEGHAGRITLNRPKALNALSYDMCLLTEKALDTWRDDPSVSIIMIDAEGDRAFCAGGDIAEMYDTGTKGDFAYGRRFWRDEYRMNAKIARYPKPVVSFLNGFVMGGGVGLGGHCSHRITGDTTQMSMPEVSIGFVPDVGGSHILARAPGRLGAFLGLTAARMGPGDAIHAGFADTYVPEAEWLALKSALAATGSTDPISQSAKPPPTAPMAEAQSEIDRFFAPDDLPALAGTVAASDHPLAAQASKALQRNAPLSMATTLRMLSNLGPASTIEDALRQEYRVSHRIMEHGDFLEGIRAAIIDKDKNPNWRHDSLTVPQADIDRMLAPLGAEELTLEDTE